MKQLFAILILSLVFFGCQKKAGETNNLYKGNWNFEIIYTSNYDGVISETIVDYQGEIQSYKNRSALKLHYCFDCYLSIIIDREGVIRNLNNELLGVIDNENCLININNPKEPSISKITIKGFK